jgi:esterase/lipase
MLNLSCVVKRCLSAMIPLISILGLTVYSNHADIDRFGEGMKNTKESMHRLLMEKYPGGQMKMASSADKDNIISVKQKIELSAPFQLKPENKNCSSKKGFLLTHGYLLDANSLKEVAYALREKYPCSVLKAVLLKGHGTLPSELISVKYTDWIDDTVRALETFSDNGIEKVYLVGHSIGGALAYKALETHSDKIKGLILFNPALKSNHYKIITTLARPIVYFKDFEKKFKHEHPVRYLSAAMNSLFQTVDLFDAVNPNVIFKIPSIQFHVSGDTSIDIQKNVSEYCKLNDKKNHEFFIFNNYYEDENFFSKYSTKGCDDQIDFKEMTLEGGTINNSIRQIGLSHVDFINKENEYHNPVNYYCSTEFSSMNRSECVDHLQNFTLGIKTDIDNFELRSTLNPLFDEMMSNVYDFIDRNDD